VQLKQLELKRSLGQLPAGYALLVQSTWANHHRCIEIFAIKLHIEIMLRKRFNENIILHNDRLLESLVLRVPWLTISSQ
jgi:hypothetical protein